MRDEYTGRKTKKRYKFPYLVKNAIEWRKEIPLCLELAKISVLVPPVQSNCKSAVEGVLNNDQS